MAIITMNKSLHRAAVTILSILLLVPSFIVVTANDECSNAVTITTPLPFTVNGDTTSATVDFPNPTDNFRNLTCGIGVEGRGIWYKYVGDDQFIRAHVILPQFTSDGSTPGKWDIKTALFQIYNSQSDCHVDDLECMTSSQYTKMYERTTSPISEWYAHSGITYLLHVSGVTDDDVGEFELTVEVSWDAFLVSPRDMSSRARFGSQFSPCC